MPSLESKNPLENQGETSPVFRSRSAPPCARTCGSRTQRAEFGALAPQALWETMAHLSK
jgi:hypothetical protein